MENDLKLTIQNLYTVFKPYTINENLRGRSCACCVSDNEIDILFSKPLNNLEIDDLQHFMSSAITTFGNTEDYKHFLPRILELLQNIDFLEDFLVYEKLNYCKWNTWNKNEVDTINNYFLTLWKVLINKEFESSEIEKTLELISLYGSFEKALNIWERSIPEKGVQYIIDNVINYHNYKMNLSEEHFLIYSNWISSKKILLKIENLFFITKNKEDANLISIAYSLLENKKCF